MKKLPAGIQTLIEMINNNAACVDKTGLAVDLANRCSQTPPVIRIDEYDKSIPDNIIKQEMAREKNIMEFVREAV